MLRTLFATAKVAVAQLREEGTIDTLKEHARDFKREMTHELDRYRWFDAARRGQVGEMIVIHLRHPEAVEWRDEDGNTALLFCAQVAHRQVNYDACKFLLENGADPHHRNRAGQNAVDLGMITEYPLDPLFSTWVDDDEDAPQSWTANDDPDTQSAPVAPAPQTADNGVFAVDEDGFVKAADGSTVAGFGDQKEAAHWILKVGQAQSLSQRFEIALHPSRTGYAAVARTIAPSP